MTYNRNQARPLLNDTEYKLFISSLADHIGELDRKALGQTITRTRRARDKYRDLAKRQNTATRERAGARGAAHTANERTDVKATIFGEALDRLEKRRERLEADERRAARRAVLDRKAAQRAPVNRAERRSRKAAAAPAKGAFMSDRASASNQAAIRAPQTRIAASRGAATRRAQANRDR
ncbi:MAG TPA: hypothetical protein VM388_12765 [Acidimicrobiales bacterium]|nr:hypothetical protein [Acidimicrobiales bacterium]